MAVLPQLRDRRENTISDARRFFFELGQTPEAGLAPSAGNSFSAAAPARIAEKASEGVK